VSTSAAVAASARDVAVPRNGVVEVMSVGPFLFVEMGTGSRSEFRRGGSGT
jgi:hypothetical protein